MHGVGCGRAGLGKGYMHGMGSGGRSILVGVTGFKLTISMCSLIR